jgi:hypothetical protein
MVVRHLVESKMSPSLRADEWQVKWMSEGYEVHRASNCSFKTERSN